MIMKIIISADHSGSVVGCGGDMDAKGIKRLFKQLKREARDGELSCHFGGNDHVISDDNKATITKLKKEFLSNPNATIECEIDDYGYDPTWVHAWNKDGRNFSVNAGYVEGSGFDIVSYFERELRCEEEDDDDY